MPSAGIPHGATIVRIAGEEVNSWHDVRRIGATLPTEQSVPIVVRLPDSQEENSPGAAAAGGGHRPDQVVSLSARPAAARAHRSAPHDEPGDGRRLGRDARRATSIVQFYITLKRMFQRSIRLSNAMGPVGIVQAGAKFACKGTDWLIWFLAQISANLAVVNFLPIPIVDGGLFLFLIIEKSRANRCPAHAIDRAGRGVGADRERVPVRDVSGHHAVRADERDCNLPPVRCLLCADDGPNCQCAGGQPASSCAHCDPAPVTWLVREGISTQIQSRCKELQRPHATAVCCRHDWWWAVRRSSAQWRGNT